MKKFLSLVLALVMTMSLVTISAGAKDFTDASKITYEEAVDVLSAIKVIDGDTTGAFNPQGGLTRGAAAKIICNMILGPTTAAALHADTAPFKDVPADSTFAGYIAYCAQQGITSGYTDGTYRPAAPLTGYAFMKMLLGALGYDKAVEGYDGANWSINVAKRALNIGLDKGLVDDFNGAKAVTREEAALYALNTLKATMVEYDAKTNISVGGAEVIIAGSAAKDVTCNKGQGTDGNIKNDGYVQFAEKYFTKLDLVDGITDDFARPAHKWYVKNDKVGTYTDTPDVTYTKNVELGKIYKDLDLSEKIDAALYFNGVYDEDVAVAKGNTNELSDYNDIGNGTITEVYYDRDNDAIDIISIAVYVGEISTVKAATAAYDAYVKVAQFNATSPLTLTNNKFETDDEFEEDDVVLFTFSAKEGKIESVEKAEQKEAVLNTIYKNSKLTLSGETISYAKTHEFEANESESELVVKGEYYYYLDNNGYIAYIIEKDFLSGDYAFVEATHSAAGNTFDSNKVKLVYTDGTTGKVTTDKDYKAGSLGEFAYYIVTYKTNTAGETVLRKVDNAYHYELGNAIIENGNAKIQVNDGTSAYAVSYANSDTIVVVKNAQDKYHAYTGVKNMPTIKGSVDLAAVYTKNNSSIAKLVFIDANPSTKITSGVKDVTYFALNSMSKHTTDTDLTDYYTYNVVTGGEITTMRVEASMVAQKTTYGGKAFINLSFNEDSEVIGQSAASGAAFTDVTKLNGDHTMGFKTAGSWAYWTIDDDCDVFFADGDGEITKGDVADIPTSDYDGWYVLDTDTYTVTSIFVEVPEDGDSINPSAPTLGFDVTGTTVVTAAKGSKFKVSLLGTGTIPAGYTVSVDLYKANLYEGDGKIGATQTYPAVPAGGYAVTAYVACESAVNVPNVAGNYYVVVFVSDTSGNIVDRVMSDIVYIA